MPFNRPPRIQKPLPKDTIEIPTPVNLPSKPGPMDRMTIFLSFGAIILTIVFVMLVSGVSGGGFAAGLGYLIFLPLMLVSYVGTWFTSRSAKKKYEQDLAQAKQEYDQALSVTERRLQDLQGQQRQTMLEVDPDLNECSRRVNVQDARLGERRPEDPDFLQPRLGLGTVATSFALTNVDPKNRSPELKEQYARADSMFQKLSIVKDAPITLNFPKTGSIGIAGQSKEIRDIVRALICQIAVQHWNSEVQMAAIGEGNETWAEWDWMRHLPHATSLVDWRTLQSGNYKESRTQFMTSLEKLLQSREDLIEAERETGSQSSAEKRMILPQVVIIFDQLSTTFNHPALSLLFQKGCELGIYGIFLAANVKDIPGGCGATIEFQNGKWVYEETGINGRIAKCERPDTYNTRQAGEVANKLGSIEWNHIADLSRPPSRLGFLEMFGANRLEELDIEDWWENGSPYGYLKVPIGRISEKAPLIFDLSDRDGAHGPHGVIGGITGSGKSEVLKTVILALALTHHPYDLNFALVDYKGGAAFNELLKLPHTVGVVTDIETHASYAERVILALSGEIEHRKKILEDARSAFGMGRTHIDEYRKLPVKRLLPRLVIIFDEFAEFKQRHPEESRRLISIARLGRSLGIHLVLATQNIQAAVDPEILQNATFRICLRVSDPQDSMQLVGVRDAVVLPRGRAYFAAQTRYLFQAAYSGNLYRPATGDTTTISKTGVQFLSTERTEAQAIAERLIVAAENLNIRKPPAIWPEPLPEKERLYLPKLLQDNVEGGWDDRNSKWKPSHSRSKDSSPDPTVYPIIGLCDQPAQQRQSILQVDPSRGEGHLLIFGSSKVGKSTLLKTFATSLFYTRTPEDAWIYILDFGGQSALKVLEHFPHVGAVVTRFEIERAQRLIEFIHARIAERNELFRKASKDSLIDYNASLKDKKQKLPVIYLIIDGFSNLKRTFMNIPGGTELVGSITSLISGGLATGVHLVIASNLSSDLSQDLFGNVNLRMTMHQADHRSYFEIVGQPSEAKIKEDVSRMPVPGRGLLRGSPPLEFQAALPVVGASDGEQYEALAALGNKMTKAWQSQDGKFPSDVGSLPLLIALPEAWKDSSQISKRPLFLPLGKDYETLAEVGFALDKDGPSFLIAGSSPRSGKTSLLTTWLIGLNERYTKKDIQVYLIDFHSRKLSSLSHISLMAKYVGIKSDLEPTLDLLEAEIKKRADQTEKAYQKSPDLFDIGKIIESLPQIVVAIDSYEIFSSKIEENERRKLANCLVSGEEYGVAFLVAGDLSKLPSEFGGVGPSFVQRLKQQGCGVLLGGSEGVESFNNARVPAFQRAANLPPGRGYLIQRGQGKMFQAYAYWKENESPQTALERRIKGKK